MIDSTLFMARTIRNYELVRELGSGHFGTVYAAVGEVPGRGLSAGKRRLVAIKKLNDQLNHLKDSLRQAVLPQAQFKKLHKQDQKKEKAELSFILPFDPIQDWLSIEILPSDSSQSELGVGTNCSFE